MEKFRKQKYVDITGESINGCVAVRYMYSIKKQYKSNKPVLDYWEWKCPYCGELFVAGRYSVKYGLTRSCGCLVKEHARKMGTNTKKYNVLQYTPWNYVRVFFNNLRNVYCLVDEKNAHIFEKYNATADKRVRGEGIDPIITLNGKKTRLYDYIMGTNTANGEVCDHLNHQTLDCRECNCRNGTHLQNQANTPKGVGRVISLKGRKYGIKFPDELGIDTSEYIYDTWDEAEKKRKQLEDDIFGDWTFEKSQIISKKIETYELIKDSWVDRWATTGTIGKIMRLPPSNPLNARLRDLIVLIKGGKIPPDEEWRLQHELMYDYYQVMKKQIENQ